MRRWRIVVLALLLMISGLISHGVSHAERARPFRIGALTASWGPTPMIVGLRDGLVELGYQEDVDFVLGIRFTQGNLVVLPEAALELVSYGVDLIVASEDAPGHGCPAGDPSDSNRVCECKQPHRHGVDPKLCSAWR